jgi:hypothetical protein
VSENLQTPALPDTTPLKRLIRRTRRLLRSSWVVTGLGLTVGLLLGTLVAATLVDLLTPLGAALRAAALVLIAVPAGLVLLAAVIRPLVKRLTAVTVARRIEKHIPGIHNRLVSSIDLSANGKPVVSQAFYRRLLTEALDRVRGFKARKVVDFLRLRRAALYAVSSTAAFVLALYLFSDRLPTAIARILHPFDDIPPATGVVYAVISPGDKVQLRGDDIVFVAEVTKGEPEGLTLVCKSDEADKPLRYELEKRGVSERGNPVWTTTLGGKLPAGFDKEFTYRVYGGGTWTRRHTLKLVERPVITDMYTVVHHPKYMDLPPAKRLSTAHTEEVAGPTGGKIEVVVGSRGDVTKGEIQIVEERTKRERVKFRPERIWFEKDVPAGAAKESWSWNHEAYHERQHAHFSDAPAFGGVPAGHGFANAKTGFRIQPGEDLFAYAFIPPDKRPKTILLEWHDGPSGEHRAYWGDDPVTKPKNANPAAWQRVGDLPVAGQWVRLEVPAQRVGLEGKALHGMRFLMVDGQCMFQSAGALPPGYKNKKIFVASKRYPMKSAGKNAWSGKFPLRGKGLFRVELRDALDHPSKEISPSHFKTLPDDPPIVILDRPDESPLMLSTPRKVRLAVRASDDWGLKEVAVYTKRSGAADWSRRVIRRYKKPRLDDLDITSTFDLKAMKLVLGDSLQYKVEAVDRKNQATVSPEYVIQLSTAPNSADQKLVDFEKTQEPFEARLANLIASQAKIQEEMKKLTAKYEPLLAKIKAAKAEAESKIDPASSKLLDAVRQKLTDLAVEKEKAKELGLKPAPNQPQPPLDADSNKVLAEAQQKLNELAQERAKNANPDVTPNPQDVKLDAESQQVLNSMKDKLSELARMKALTAGKQPKTPVKNAKLDKASAKLLAKLEKKLRELEREKDKSNPTEKPVQLDAKNAQDLAAMQRELAQLTGQQQANLQQGDQLGKDLTRAADEADKLQMLRGEIARQMRAAANAFDKQAVQAMKKLAEQLGKAAAAKKENPPDGKDLENIAQRNERLKKELEALKKRLEALAKARKDLLNDPDKALAKLKEDMLKDATGLSARELKELQEYLAKLQKELAKQKGNQEKLLDETKKSPDKDLPDALKKQDDLDKKIAKALKMAKMFKNKKFDRKRKLNRPKSPYRPEGDDEKLPPKEEDSDEPLPEKKTDKKPAKDKPTKPDAKEKKKKDEDDEDDEDNYLPKLGGKRPKIDPRYAKKMPKHKKKPKKGDSTDDEDDDADKKRDDLEDRQTDNLRDLDAAEKSADADAQTLQDMINQLERALQKSQGKNGQQGENDAEANEALEQLARMLGSDALRQALAMAARAQGQNREGSQQLNSSNPTGNEGNVRIDKTDLSKLDLPTRTMILKMQARPRERLNQGRKKQGPPGYQKFIEEYYNRLGKIKAGKK